jgi:isopenicillin-N N-acyltransferase-like protein
MKDCGAIKYIECQGSPYEMGVQYGTEAACEINKILAGNAYKWVEQKIKNDRQFVEKLSCNILEQFPYIYQELKGIADGSGQGYEAIMLLNHYNNPRFSSDKCTPLGLVSATDGNIISKNNDGAPGEKEQYPFVIRKTVPSKGFGFPMIQLTYAGWLSGLDSMNGAGLANTHGSVGSAFQRYDYDVDIRLAVYNAMRNSENLDNFKSILRKFPLSGKGFNILVGDAMGNTVILEAAVPLLIERAHNKKFSFTTNHYISECLKDSDGRTAKGKELSKLRLGYLKWVEETAPPENLKGLKKILASHEPWAPCRHAGPHVSVTEWSAIFLTKTRTVLLADNNPCSNEYLEYHI